MSVLEFIGLALLVTVTMGTVDYAHARYSLAMADVRRGEPARHRAARWSVVQWAAASVGFVVAVKVSIWFLPMEAVGLYLGTWFGSRNHGPSTVS